MYTVVYHRGGTHNGRWYRTTPVRTLEEAQTRKSELKRAGYPAIIFQTRHA